MYIEEVKNPNNGSKSQVKGYNPLDKPNPLRYVPLLMWGMILLLLVNSCNNSRKLDKAIQNKPYIYVQKQDAEMVKAKPVNPLHREEKVLKDFGETWLRIAFTWQKTSSKEKNYVTEKGVNYPIEFHLASLAIKPGIREAYMKSTYEKYRDQFTLAKYIANQYQSRIDIYYQPIVTAVQDESGAVIPGLWDVKIVAIRTHAQDKSIIAHEVFNRVIRLRAIKPSDEKYLWGDKTSDLSLGELLNQMQKQGLQVIQITEF
ncbi:MAG: hypothetical protein QNJ60_00385 [Xenococcaceae cyanobacterium MO_188.B19]|nr:hypothetical protein [Xenococcaceae cyanobacterium MO_188.B19]